MKHLVALNKSSESFFHLKMATRFLVSVSVFSIIVSYSSLLPVLLNSFKFSFSAYKNIDKNYVFLLCNGILVFIFKNSGGFTKNSPQEAAVINRREGVRLSQRKESIVEKKVVQETQELALVAVVAEEKQEQENQFEDEEEINGLPSREELNKKCEEFIRKMKEVIKCEH